MDVVIRPVNDRFLAEVAFPGFELGVVDAMSGLEFLAQHLVDERTKTLIELLLERGVEGSFFSLEEDKWIEAVYRLLFWEWREVDGGWEITHEYLGFAGDWDEALHLALMLEDAHYPYHDEAAARVARQAFAKLPDPDVG